MYRVTYRLHDGKTPHRGDCQLNIGLMRTIGPVFGLPPLEIEHTACQVDGAPECQYTVRWTRRRFGRKRAQLRARNDQGVCGGLCFILEITSISRH